MKNADDSNTRTGHLLIGKHFTPALLEELWSPADVVLTDSFSSGEAEYPGHDPGGPASIEYGVYALTNSLLVLSRAQGLAQDECQGELVSEEDEPPVRIGLVARIPKTLTALEHLLEKESIQEWETDFSPIRFDFTDNTPDLACLLKSEYKAPSGGRLKVDHLVTVIASDPGSFRVDYLAWDGKDVSVDAVAGYRSGVISSRLVYDEPSISFLEAFHVPVQRSTKVHRGRVKTAAVERLVSSSKKTSHAERISSLEDQLGQAEGRVERLQNDLEWLKAH